MELTKDNWNKNDISEFQAYLVSNANLDRVEWASNMLQTKLPVLCLKTSVIKDTINGIKKGNYLEFLDLMIWQYYENTAINGYLISVIPDFHLKKKYLDKYSDLADNWATCDLLTFDINGNEKNYFNITLEYIKAVNPIKRRIGMYILFNYIDKEEYIEKIFDLLDQFQNEKEYYVNVMNAWLLSECFIKQKSATLKYLDKHKLNKFTINKFVQKCRESRRVTVQEKEMLLKYKEK